MSNEKYDSELDKFKAKKKELAESEEYLKNVDEGGANFVKQFEDENVRLAKKAIDDENTYLEGFDDEVYLLKLKSYADRKMEKLDYPKGFEYYVAISNKKPIRIGWTGETINTSHYGLIFFLRNPNKQIYFKAFKIEQNPLFDTKAVDTFVRLAEDLIDDWKGLIVDKKTGEKKTKGGIILP